MLITGNYHYIRESYDAPFPSIFGVTPASFENQLKQLKDIGKFVNQRELLENTEYIIRSNEKFLLVTFDDGLKEQYEVAKPILDRLNIEAIYFINSINHIEKRVSMVHQIQLVRSVYAPKKIVDEVEKIGVKLTREEMIKATKHYNYDSAEAAATKYLLNFKLNLGLRDQIVNQLFKSYFDEEKVLTELYMSNKQLKHLGEELALGNHTHSHLGLGIYDYNIINEEVKKTKNFLEKSTNQEIKTISYPYGSKEACADPVSAIAQSTGHKVGFTMHRDIAKEEDSYLLLNRFDCNDLPGGKNESLFRSISNINN